MNVKLTPHAAQLLEAARSRYNEPDEAILEHALEILACEEHAEATAQPSQHEAVADMLDFVKRNRVHLDAGISVRDFVLEGRRV